MYSYTDNAYATHQPFLKKYVRETSGDIFEFGTGFGSTGLLRSCIEGTSRKLISIEDNKEWYEKMIKHYPPSEQHTLLLLERKEDGSHWAEFLSIFKHSNPISVVFIDQSPWSSRIETFRKLDSIAEYCIIHDADYFPLYGNFGKVTDPSLRYSDETKYDFSDEMKKYKLYFPPAPWSDTNRGPPTLVSTSKDLPIYPYDEIEFTES
jgi:hypothetical protein